MASHPDAQSRVWATPLTVDRVTITVAADQRVCNLTVRDYHTFMVGPQEVLAHNDSWCQEILNSKFASDWLGKKEVLLAKLDEINAVRLKNGLEELSETVVHGHHIVMKNHPGAAAARKILHDYDIPVLLTKDQIRNAKSLDDLANISMALNINGVTGIHLDDYAQAVNDGLKAIVDAGLAKGLSKDGIKGKLIAQLGKWRETLEDGGTFWNGIQ